MGMSGSRYFEFAELLDSYQGAVRMRFLVEQQNPEVPPVELSTPVAAGAADVSPELLAAMSHHPGFPGIECD